MSIKLTHYSILLTAENKGIYMGLFKVIGIFAAGLVIGYTLTLLANDSPNLLDENALSIESEFIIENTAKTMPIDTHKSAIEQPLTTTASDSAELERQFSNKEKHQTTEVISVNSGTSEEASLNQKYEKLKQELSQSKHRIQALNRQIGDLGGSDVTDEELLANVPEEYEGLIVNFSGKTRDEIADFHKQPEDLDSGFVLSDNISSFIVSHAYSYGVELSSIICKQSYCELMVKEKEKPSWDKIFHEMTQQEWWSFYSTNATSTTDENDNTLIYVFMANNQPQ